MYARKITFTLLAPSIWPVIEAVGKTHIGDDYRRYLMKTNSNSGLLMEVFASRQNASQKLEPKSIGEEVLYCAIRKPFEIIMQNAGISYDNIPNEEGIGYNVVTGKTVDMVKAGIIDPLLVTKSALKNAASVATTILSTDCIINNIRNESGR